MSDHPALLGVITTGSLVEGMEMKLDASQDVEDIKAGKFVVIKGQKHEFFSMITDMRLDATNPEILVNPPDEEDLLMRQVLSGQSTYATVCLRPMLMMSMTERLTGDEELKPLPIPPDMEERWHVEEDFLRAVRGESTDPRPSFLDGLRNMEYLEAVYASTKEGRWVDLP